MNHEDLDIRQKKAIELFEGKESVFLTGKAGTGKSLILKNWQKSTDKKIVILAPTGIAAINIQGQTIHSFFGFQPGILPEEAKAEAHEITPQKLNLLKKLDAIVIDEVSMVRADLIDAIDIYLSEIFSNDYKKNLDFQEKRLIETPPFGGIQMILIGDLFQLPPVVTKDDQVIFKKHYPGPYFFQSQVFSIKNFNPILFELKYLYRQEEDPTFQKILNHIRHRSLSTELLDRLNQRVIKKKNNEETVSRKELEKAIYLTSRNSQATTLNEQKLNSIDSPIHKFKAEISGKIDPGFFPTDKELTLKKGARIMFIKNDHVQGWLNGTMGTLIDFISSNGEKGILVQKDDLETVEVFPELWEISRYTLEKNQIFRIPVGSFLQLPIKLAWAITIHKSQGKTFPKLIIDLSHRLFSHGQAYVALSRGTHLAGLHLTHPLKISDIQVDREVINFFKRYHEKKQSREEIISLLSQAINQNLEATIRYLSNQNQVEQRKLIPKKLEVMIFKESQFLGLTAYCFLRQSEKIFSVDRISQIELSSNIRSTSKIHKKK